MINMIKQLFNSLTDRLVVVTRLMILSQNVTCQPSPVKPLCRSSLARKAVKHDWHIVHDTMKIEVNPCVLKSRQPYHREVQEMLSVIPENRSKDAWIAAAWKQEWEASEPTRVHRHVSDPEEGVRWEDLCGKHWTTLNRLRS